MFAKSRGGESDTRGSTLVGGVRVILQNEPPEVKVCQFSASERSRKLGHFVNCLVSVNCSVPLGAATHVLGILIHPGHGLNRNPFSE